MDLENNTFDVTEQLSFKVPPKTKVIEEMAPPKSNGRKLPITELARPFFLKQLAMQEVQKEQAAKDGKPYYDNDLVVAKPDGAPIAASWVSSQFGKLLEDLDMPHIRFHDLRHTAATNMHQLTGDFYTVGEVLGHTLAGIGASLGLSMNFEAVTARYVAQQTAPARHAGPKPSGLSGDCETAKRQGYGQVETDCKGGESNENYENNRQSNCQNEQDEIG